MNEFPTHFDAPEDAYFGFFRADSAKNAPGWAAVMSYPHTRVSATGNRPYYPTPEDYAARASWTAREATGWVRSVGVEPVRIHESERKVHLAGGWTRYNADDQPILTNRVTYILTRPDDSWGIQARFGVDSYTGNVNEDAAAAAIEVVGQYLAALASNDHAACADLSSYPFTQVGVGEVHRVGNGDELRDLLAKEPRRVGNPELSAVQSGTDGVVVASTVAHENAREHAVFIVAKEGGWRIAGASFLTP